MLYRFAKLKNYGYTRDSALLKRGILSCVIPLCEVVELRMVIRDAAL